MPGVKQSGDDGRLIVGDGPVDGEAVVIVFEGDELGVCLWRWRSGSWESEVLGEERALRSVVIRRRWLCVG